jgi:hypothetical protein
VLAVDASSLEYIPETHAVQDDAPSESENLPATQSVHVAAVLDV